MRTRIATTVLVVILTVIGCVLTLAHLRNAQLEGERLELTIARLPSGITTEEADRMVGTGPDKISRRSGVLVNSVTFMTADNSKAAMYGKPQLYELRTWRRGAVNATVVVGQDGLVAGRYVWR